VYVIVSSRKEREASCMKFELAMAGFLRQVNYIISHTQTLETE
jgi:hypothetical protein